MNTKKFCDDCKYYDVKGESCNPTLGLCRINSPQPHPEPLKDGLFPVVTGEDWCGQFEAKEIINCDRDHARNKERIRPSNL